jgi:uncharacterized RDD family membrane protein YckC
VRRATPELPRLRSEPRAPLLEWSDPAPASPTATPIPGSQASAARHAAAHRQDAGSDLTQPAGFLPRAVATVIDLLLLLTVDVIVIYFTLKICRLPIADWALLPKAPLLTFLLMQNGGYIVAFTTTGQTLGKMIAGVRVLADDDDRAPDVGRSTMRAALWMILALPAGLGLLSAALSSDRRGLHDRFAGTRVVRAGA